MLADWLNIISTGLSTGATVYGSASAEKVAKAQKDAAAINAGAMVTVVKVVAFIAIAYFGFKLFINKKKGRK